MPVLLGVVFVVMLTVDLLPGDAVASVLEFADNYHDDIPNYLYNVADRQYDRVLIGYETRPLPAAHRLPETLKARVLFF